MSTVTRDVNVRIYWRTRGFLRGVSVFRVIIKLFNSRLPILCLSASVFLIPTRVPNPFTVTLDWCQHIITRWEIDGPAAKNSCWLSGRLTLSEKWCCYAPSGWHRYEEAVLAAWRGAHVPLQRRSESGTPGAELCESLLKGSLWWISFTAAWNAHLSREAHVWHSFKASKIINLKQQNLKPQQKVRKRKKWWAALLNL